MRNLKTVGAIAAGALAATALTGVAVATSAIADDESTTQTTPDVSGTDEDHGAEHADGRRGPGGRPGGPGMERGVLHGEMVVETPEGEIVTKAVQRGEVTAVSSTSISVTSDDGYSATYAIDADTEQKRDRQDGTAQVGDTVHVVATVEGSTSTAERVMAMSPEAVAEMEAQREVMEQWLSERPEGGDRDALQEWMSQRPEGAKGPGGKGGMRGPGGPRGERPGAPADGSTDGATNPAAFGV